MKKWNLIIDVAKGVDFINAVLSAKDEYVGNDHPGYSAPVALEASDIVTLERKVRGEAPLVDAVNVLRMCNHCDDAPCLKIGGDAVRKREDGIVIIDPEKARGRKDLVAACPYDAIVWNEKLELPQAWIFDAHLLDQGWSEPRCIAACASGGIEAVKLSDADMQKRAEEEQLEVLHPELGTKPRIYYRNLYRYNSVLVGGTVVAVTDSIEDCLEGATATLVCQDAVQGVSETDTFGEFRFDRLAPNKGAGEVRITCAGYAPRTVPVDIQESTYLGVLRLEPL
ncbi:MAG: 4Fe-4S dicluster domain-containing protein [Pseudomonadota bacterium]